MKILAIDTSNRPLSVAILEDKRLLAETTTNVLRNHSTTLMPIVEDLLKKAATTIQEIDRFVVAKGPGSYTGLRIGVTTAKTFAFTLNKELVGVSSLKVLAANYKNTNRVIVPLFDARRQNVFAGVYRWENGELVNVMPDRHISLEKLQEKLKDNEVVFIGEDAIKLEKEISEFFAGEDYIFAEGKDNYPSAMVLGVSGQKESVVENINDFIPDYLRLTQAEKQWLDKNSDEKIKYVKKFNDQL